MPLSVDDKNYKLYQIPVTFSRVQLTWEIDELMQPSLAISTPTKDLNLAKKFAIYNLRTVTCPPLEVVADNKIIP